MKWSNLKNNHCPQCNGDFIKTMVNVGEENIGCNCGFVISHKKYKEIVADRVIQDLQNDQEGDVLEEEL